MDIGRKIHDLRMLHGLTQEERPTGRSFPRDSSPSWSAI
jgi:hypothetical protein